MTILPASQVGDDQVGQIGAVEHQGERLHDLFLRNAVTFRSMKTKCGDRGIGIGVVRLVIGQKEFVDDLQSVRASDCQVAGDQGIEPRLLTAIGRAHELFE